MNPQVSIIVPVYNAEAYLARCVDSLTGQTLENIEIILVDDGSADASPALCDSFAAVDGRIRALHQENAGAGMARNRGLALAQGEYVGFVDADDYVDRNMYEALYQAAAAHSADMVLAGTRHVGGIVFGGNDELRSCFTETEIFSGDEGIKRLMLGTAGALPNEQEDSRYGFSTCKNLYRNACIRENGLQFVSERDFLSEDLLFLLDFIRCAKKAVGIPGAFYNYCRNGGSFSKSYREKRFCQSLLLIEEMEKRLSAVMPTEQYQIYLDRQLLAYARVATTQEVMHGADSGIDKRELAGRLRAICLNPVVHRAMKRYPYWRLPRMQAAFAFAMRYGLTGLERLLVALRKKL